MPSTCTSCSSLSWPEYGCLCIADGRNLSLNNERQGCISPVISAQTVGRPPLIICLSRSLIFRVAFSLTIEELHIRVRVGVPDVILLEGFRSIQQEVSILVLTLALTPVIPPGVLLSRMVEPELSRVVVFVNRGWMGTSRWISDARKIRRIRLI